MSIYRPKKSPFWHYDFQIRGVRFFGSTGAKERNAARKIEAAKRTEAAVASSIKRRPAMTLNAAAGRYYEEVSRGQSSVATTDYQLANLIKGLGRDSLLSAITDNEISTYVAQRRAQVAPASVNRETELLRRVFNRAATVWKVDVGEVPTWKELLLEEPDGRNPSLPSEKEAELLAHLPDDLRRLVRFAILTGMRLMNVARLTWSQIDFEAREIDIRLKSKKPGGRQHIVPISAGVAGLLYGQQGKHPIYVFTYTCRRSRGGRRKGERYPFSASGWRKDWKRALVAAGIDDFRFHDLRHVAGSRTARAGGLPVTKDLLGHKDIASTMRYVHATRGDVREAMERAESRNNPEAIKLSPATPLKKGT
jgi:integrase